MAEILSNSSRFRIGVSIHGGDDWMMVPGSGQYCGYERRNNDKIGEFCRYIIRINLISSQLYSRQPGDMSRGHIAF